MFQNNHSPPFGHLERLSNSEEDHDEFTERLRKSLYYGKLPGTERPSLPLTDMAVEFFQEAAPRKLGRLDTYFASSSARSACMTPSSVIVGMMYVKKLQKRRPEYLAQISSSELFLISMMMASKFMYDEGVDEEVFNDEWATSGDLDTEDVNELERDFLTAIDWELFVRPDDFSDMLDTVEKRLALSQGLDRGWFSYTDLYILSKDLKFMSWNELAVELSKVVSVSSLAYLASVLTMIGSTVLGTTTSTALVSAGAAVLPLSHNALLLPVSMPDSEIGRILMQDITGELDAGNTTGVDFGAVKHLTETTIQSGIEHIQNNVVGNQNQESRDTRKDLAQHSPDGDNREHGTFFNGFLPPFLALVALKDTIVKFAYAVADKPEASRGDFDSGDQVTQICSDGPCLMDSWPDCWNVSSEFDWTEFKTFHSQCASGESRGCRLPSQSSRIHVDHTRPDLATLEQCKLRNKLLNKEPWSRVTTGVHCCCTWSENSQRFDFASLNPQLPDLAYGFMTSSILVTA